MEAWGYCYKAELILDLVGAGSLRTNWPAGLTLLYLAGFTSDVVRCIELSRRDEPQTDTPACQKAAEASS